MTQSLLRNLQETWIDVRFIFVTGSNLWVDSYLLETEIQWKKFAGNARSIRLRCPNLDTSQNSIGENELTLMEQRHRKALSDFRRKHTSYPAIPGVNSRNIHEKPYTLRERAVITDYYLATRIAPKQLRYSDEWQYLMVYKHLCGGTHIAADYLASNIQQYDRKGVSILIHGKLNSTQLVAWSAYAFLYDLSVVFSKQFGLPARADLKPYRKQMKALMHKIPA